MPRGPWDAVLAPVALVGRRRPLLGAAATADRGRSLRPAPSCYRGWWCTGPA